MSKPLLGLFGVYVALRLPGAPVRLVQELSGDALVETYRVDCLGIDLPYAAAWARDLL